MKKILNYLKYSGIWIGVVINPYHWRFGLKQGSGSAWEEYLFDNALHLGPVWIRVIIDDGSW